MKRLSAILLAASLSLAAADSVDLKVNMLKLNESLKTLQTAFIYGNKDLAISSANDLKKANAELFKNPEYIKGILPEGKKHMSSVAFNSAKLIDKYATEITETIDSKQYYKAQEAFHGVVHSCMKCHNIIRDW